MQSLVVANASPSLVATLERWNEHARGSFSPNTQRAVRADLAIFGVWCSGAEESPLPASPDAVARFLREQAAAERKHATVRRRAASISFAHRAAGLPNPCQSEVVRLALKAIARERGTGQGQAKGLTLREADRIAGCMTVGPKDLRDLALMLVGRDLLARASELVSITAEAVTWDEDGSAQVMLLRGKTDTEARPYQIGTEAADALRGWMHCTGITTGPVFLTLWRGGEPRGRPMRAQDVSRVLDGLARRSGLGEGFSSHSLRVGMAQDLARDQAGVPEIMAAGGWKSPAMVGRYTEAVSAKNSAVMRLHARRTRKR